MDSVWHSSKTLGSWSLGQEFDALHRCCIIMIPLFILALSCVGASLLLSVFFFNEELVHSEDTKKRTYTGRL